MITLSKVKELLDEPKYCLEHLLIFFVFGVILGTLVTGVGMIAMG